MHFLVIFVAILFALMLGNFLLRVALTAAAGPLGRIQSESVRTAATASLVGFVYASSFTLAYLIIGIGTSLLSFLVLWAMMTAIEYVLPSVRTR
ncbi:MAG: hypothetical protein K2W82_15960 [Candidatus Obscuribacterales bacterium]|nr:hypothetical protein [Candidatus Obscuribacterales bacterium]